MITIDERDLIDILLENRDISEVIEILDEILNIIEKNHKMFISKTKDLLIDLCKDLNKCPYCRQDLEVVDTYEEPRGEYWGEPAYEEVFVYGCSNCNYTEE